LTWTYKKRLSIMLWIAILVFLVIILTFPKWISMFYPRPHYDLVMEYSAEHSIDPYLVFSIIRAESKYQAQAESSAGARGLMQIMPETAWWIAEQQGITEFDTEELMDPELNISFGCWYIANLQREFDGQIPLVVAAYNAGRGKVREWVIEQQWDGNTEKLDNIPFEETRQYVSNVLKNYEAYQAIYR